MKYDDYKSMTVFDRNTTELKKTSTKLNFMSLDSNYKIHFSRDISSLAILQIIYTEVWFKKHHISILHYCNKDSFGDYLLQ
jgi:hypothetical protein